MSLDNSPQEPDKKPASPQSSANPGSSRQSFKVRQLPKEFPNGVPAAENSVPANANGEIKSGAETNQVSQTNGNSSNGSSTVALYNAKNAEEVNLAEGVKERLIKGTRPGDRYIRLTKPAFSPGQVWEGDRYHVKIEGAEPTSGFGHFYQRVKRLLIGKPIPSSHSVHERLTKVKALAIYSSDALSSVAYATEQILIVLIMAGSGALGISIPITFAIAFLLVVVGTSYRQTIFAYPKGGGSYIVAKDNLGTTFGLIAATSLMIGYVLTVSVSVSAGGAAIISALPALQPYLVPMCVTFVVLLTIGNLRGVRESGAIFSAPTYLFVGTILGIILLGLLDYFFGIRLFTEVKKTDHLNSEPIQETVSLFLVLRAFAQGCAALTGVEAISDGVPAFKAPESKNAATTLATLITLLAIMFLGTSFLANHYAIQPAHSTDTNYESVTSQIAHHVVGDSFIYAIFQAATCLILILGANTAFADFPRLTWFLARDKFLPHLFSHQGDRLAFSTGIITLALLSGTLIVVFSANVEALVPLYAIGVFTSFTLSQSGMVKRWLRLKSPGWQRSLALNSLGATTTFTVLIILAVTQLLNGAWVVIVLIPIFYTGFMVVNKYYSKVKVEISLEDGQNEPLNMTHHTVVVPINDLNQVTLRTLSYANTLSEDVTAVHVNDNTDEISALRHKWEETNQEIPLVIVETPYRSIIGPLLAYIDLIHRRKPKEVITVVIPEFVANKWWQQLMHNQTALRLKAALLSRPGIVVTSVPYHHKN